jgi:probable dihydroxyacetone kinase regulator
MDIFLGTGRRHLMQKMDTKSLLACSLLELSKHMPIEKITVTHITENCSLRRESFYYHFCDKYQLIKWLYKKNFIENLDLYIGKEPWRHTTARYLCFVRENWEFYRSALTDTNMNNFRSCVFEDGVKVISKFVLDKQKKDQLSDDMVFYISFHCYGATNMIYDWLESGMVKKEQEVGRLIENSMPGALKKYFDNDSHSF